MTVIEHTEIIKAYFDKDPRKNNEKLWIKIANDFVSLNPDLGLTSYQIKQHYKYVIVIKEYKITWNDALELNLWELANHPTNTSITATGKERFKWNKIALQMNIHIAECGLDFKLNDKQVKQKYEYLLGLHLGKPKYDPNTTEVILVSICNNIHDDYLWTAIGRKLNFTSMDVRNYYYTNMHKHVKLEEIKEFGVVFPEDITRFIFKIHGVVL